MCVIFKNLFYYMSFLIFIVWDRSLTENRNFNLLGVGGVRTSSEKKNKTPRHKPETLMLGSMRCVNRLHSKLF